MTLRSLAALLFIAVPAIAAADPFAVKLPAGVTGDDETPWVVFTIESNANGKHTTRLELESLEEFSVFCTDDASECRNDAGNQGEIILHVDGQADDPKALTRTNGMLVKRKFQPLPYADLKSDGAAHPFGDLKISVTAATDKPETFDISVNGKQVRTMTLAKGDTHAEILGAALFRGKVSSWLILKYKLTNGKNQTTTWHSTDFPMP